MAETPDEVEFDEEDAQEPTYEDASPVDAMREMIEYIARALASHPDNVSVTDEGDGDHIFLRLSVDDEDKGKVIGRQGRVAQAMRVLLRVAAVKDGTQAVLEIV